MIVRKKGEYFYLFRQHQHALVSGELAAHLNLPIRPLQSTLFAISHHDVGWIDLDRVIAWDEETGEPYDFQTYPIEEKINAYRQGISMVEAKSAYAGYLCSKHYTHFFIHDHSAVAQGFRREEQIRQQELREYFTFQEEENLEKNFRLLQFCDDLSLFLCLNEPTKNTHPWFQSGIRLEENKSYEWIWENPYTLQLSPNLFRRTFTIVLPYQIVDKNRKLIEEHKYEWTVLGQDTEE